MSLGPAPNPRARRSCRARAALLGLLLLHGACGERGRPSSGGWLPGDSLSDKPRGAPVAAAESTNGSAASTPADAGEACGGDAVDPGRLDLHAAWSGGHLRVTGDVTGGSGRSLNLVLVQAGKFVFDEVFRGERLATVALSSDRLDVASVAYAPSEAERGAFARAGAVPLDPGRSACLRATLYDGLNLVAAREIAVEPR